jgi:3-hydroxyacyl-CoA dehydrogenase
LITSIRKVACVGSGLVGQGWATLFALAGYQVTIEDITEEKVHEALKRVEKQMNFLEEKGLAGGSEEAIQRVIGTTNLTEALENRSTRVTQRRKKFIKKWMRQQVTT